MAECEKLENQREMYSNEFTQASQHFTTLISYFLVFQMSAILCVFWYSFVLQQTMHLCSLTPSILQMK